MGIKMGLKILEVRISKCANFTRKFNEDTSVSSEISDGEKSSNFENSSIVKYNKMSKKSLEEKVKANDIIISGNKPAVHIVCKSIQSEKITQYQLITSNKLENYKTNEKNLKWCPIDFYERPKEAFRRNNNINVTIKDANLKKHITNCKTWFKNDKIPLSTLNIDYQVIQINDDYINIESVIDLSNNKPFLQLIDCCAHETEWEMILKLMESQLGQKIRNLSIEIEHFDEKSKLKVYSR